jgi:hypothetical protein
VWIHALAAKSFEVLKHAPDAVDGGFRALHVHSVGAEIDPDAERIFHQPEVFIAGPEKGLKVRGDLKSDLQGSRQPPRLLVKLNVRELSPVPAVCSRGGSGPAVAPTILMRKGN